MTQQQYEDARYGFLLKTEEGGVAALKSYVDLKGLITIGVGFNLNDANVRRTVLASFGISSTGADATYYQQLTTILSKSYLDPILAAKALADLDSIMFARNAGSQFSFASETQVKTAFATLAPGYEALVDQRAPGVPVVAQERIALYSLAYNTRNGSGLGRGLKAAIASGNRADAWFEIRYNTNLEASGGLAKRRYYEAQTLGLYDSAGPPTADESKQVFAALAKHRTEILNYEAKYGVPPDSATSDVAAKRIFEANRDFRLIGADQVQTLTAALAPARDAFITWVNTQLPPGETPLVAADWNPAAIAYNSPTLPMPILDARPLDGKGNGMEKNLLVGNDGNDKLLAGKGNDVLIGSKGDDFLQGGAGDDIMYGGEGQDTYVIDLRDGQQHDRIVDSDGKGRIIVIGADGNALNTIVLQQQGTANAWTDKDGLVIISHNSPWKITLADGSVIELGENFNATGFGMTLQDAPAEATTTLTGDFTKATNETETEFLIGADGNYVGTGAQPGAADQITGSAAGELIQGLLGDDALLGRGGDDLIEGGAGNDVLMGGLGASGLSVHDPRYRRNGNRGRGKLRTSRFVVLANSGRANARVVA